MSAPTPHPHVPVSPIVQPRSATQQSEKWLRISQQARQVSSAAHAIYPVRR